MKYYLVGYSVNNEHGTTVECRGGYGRMVFIIGRSYQLADYKYHPPSSKVFGNGFQPPGGAEKLHK